ncbi:MAG: hypothetical protein H3C47_08190 [Candidatus Cloacimonetes bacterium]|nr:hypothetical protein [Candidatus Cloacimonadota bacterium]
MMRSELHQKCELCVRELSRILSVKQPDYRDVQEMSVLIEEWQSCLDKLESSLLGIKEKLLSGLATDADYDCLDIDVLCLEMLRQDFIYEGLNQFILLVEQEFSGFVPAEYEERHRQNLIRVQRYRQFLN